MIGALWPLWNWFLSKKAVAVDPLSALIILSAAV